MDPEMNPEATPPASPAPQGMPPAAAPAEAPKSKRPTPRFDGPIPGENFTSDTKNYPWHRPPEFTDLDTAIEMTYKKFTDEEIGFNLLTMIEMGSDLCTIADMYVTAGIGAGKWTPDFAMLLAGPVVHILYLMAKGYDLDPVMGFESKEKIPTAAFFKTLTKIDKNKAKKSNDKVDVEKVLDGAKSAKPGGFMGMGTPEGEEPSEPVMNLGQKTVPVDEDTELAGGEE